MGCRRMKATRYEKQRGIVEFTRKKIVGISSKVKISCCSSKTVRSSVVVQHGYVNKNKFKRRTKRNRNNSENKEKVKKENKTLVNGGE